MKNYYFIFLLIVLQNISQAQTKERVNTISYNVNEGLLQSQVHDIAFDKYNFAWLSFYNGIQKFDGYRFSSVATQDGLPDDKKVNFFSDKNKTLYVSHSYGISKYDADRDRFKIIKRFGSRQEFSPIFIGEYNGRVYSFTSHNTIISFGINNTEDIIEFAEQFNLPELAGVTHTFSQKIVNGIVATIKDSTFVLYDLDKRIVVDKIPHSQRLNFQFLYLNSKADLYFYEPDVKNKELEHLKKYNFSTKKTVDILSVKRNNSLGNKTSTAEAGNSLLVSDYNRLYRNSANEITNTVEIVNVQNEPFTGRALITLVKQDWLGNTYVLTNNDGFKIIMPNYYGLKYYGIGNVEGNFIVRLCVDKERGHILAGAYGNGLLIYDTLQKLKKHINILPNNKRNFSPTGIVSMPDGGYLFINTGEKNAWKLSSDLSSIKHVSIEREDGKTVQAASYYNTTLLDNKDSAILQIGSQFYISKRTGRILQKSLNNDQGDMGTIYKNHFINFKNDYLNFYHTATNKKTKKILLKETGGVRCMTSDDTFLYIGSNKGVFKIDSLNKILYHLTKKDGLSDECIYAIHIQKNGDLWCSTNKGIFKLTPSLQILQISKDDGLQENEFNTNVVAAAEDGEIFWGGINGVSSFYPQKISAKRQNTEVIFTSIKVNNEEYKSDSVATWRIRKLQLNHTQNNLAFEFIAQLVGNPKQLVYQYKMEGVDKEWLQNNDLQPVRYFLSPGKYTFKVYASNVFTPNAKALKEIEIVIKPPFWNTWWFMTLLSLLAISMIYFVINRSQARKYEKKLDALAHEKDLKEEREKISKDLHDSIGAYANVVLYKTEMLKDEGNFDEMHNHVSDLEFATKDIIVSLRENIWALKQDSFSAEECFLRIKTFVHAITRYYPHINFKIRGQAPNDKILHYRDALHAVRIVQESLTNALKHSKAKNITVTSVESNEVWQLSVVDDGIGFEYKSLENEALGYGLKNMEYRAAEARFNYKLNSKPGEGTEIILYIKE